MNSGSLKSHLVKDQISSHVQKEVNYVPWNTLNFYLFSAKIVCTLFRSTATMPDLSALFPVNSRSMPTGLN